MAIRGMHIKATVKSHLTLRRTVTIKDRLQQVLAKNGEADPLGCAGGMIKWHSYHGNEMETNENVKSPSSPPRLVLKRPKTWAWPRW